VSEIGEVGARPELDHGILQRDIVVIGASAGGVEALRSLVAGLPPELPAAVFVVLHVLPSGTSLLSQILARQTRLVVAPAGDGEPIERGRIYVAPPDHHMLVERGRVRLTRGPRENGHRPAVDPLFRSAARAYGQRVIGIVLSGALDDGAAGLKMISDNGGTGVVQDPAGALYPSMPRSALAGDATARAVPIEELPGTLCSMIDEPLERLAPAAPPRKPKVGPGTHDDRADDSDPRSGTITGLTCPECGGALWEHDETGVLRFKCHVGHAYSADSLEVSQAQALESALWAAMRSLQERADMFRRLARRSGDGQRLDAKATDADSHADILRSLVTSFGREPGESGEADEATA
jgi:two-component system, chemotaxis family, protein-glutamate methylesterase/glutaminase